MASFIVSAFADEAGSTLEEQISALKDNGITLIEPRNLNGKSFIELSESELKNIKQALDQNGIKVGSLGSPIGKFSINEGFEDQLIRFNTAIKVCNILGTDRMRMFSFFVDPKDFNEYRSEIIHRLTVMCKIAKKNRVTLCHENESAIYGVNPENIKDLLCSVPDLYGILDPANYVMNKCNVMEGLESTFTRFGYVHIKDAIESTQEIVPCGEGDGQIPSVLEVIDKRIDGTVMLTLEPHLHVFDAYASIDKHELKGRYQFATQRAAFDHAADALMNILKSLGYRKDTEGLWIK